MFSLTESRTQKAMLRTWMKLGGTFLYLMEPQTLQQNWILRGRVDRVVQTRPKIG